MQYTYTIERGSAKQGFLRVRYESDGNPALHKILNPSNFEPDYLRELIERQAVTVFAEWERMARVPDLTEADLPELSGTVTYVAPEPAVTEPTAAEILARAIGNVTFERQEQEGSGVVWVAPETNQTYFLDTTVDSQNRFSAARLAVEAGERVDGGVWKCAELIAGAPVLTFRPTLNSEIITWSGLVHAHVQRCFEAEAAAVQKLTVGIETTFAQEFAAL